MKTEVSAMTHVPKPIRPPGLFKRIVYWILDLDDEATLEEGRRRMHSRPGLLASLSPEQLEMIRNYDGPENLGSPLSERQLRRIVKRLSQP